MNTFKKLDWDCTKSGCFNTQRRLDFGVFYDCFYDRISMSDIDAAVEINGNFLFIEWKSGGGKLKRAQEIFFERLTRHSNIFVFVVSGDAVTMEVHGYTVISGGSHNETFVKCNLDGFKKVLKEFNDWAVKNPCTGGFTT